jgi:hypothetical protein
MLDPGLPQAPTTGIASGVVIPSKPTAYNPVEPDRASSFTISRNLTQGNSGVPTLELPGKE